MEQAVKGGSEMGDVMDVVRLEGAEEAVHGRAPDWPKAGTVEERFPLMDPMPEAWDNGEIYDSEANALTPRLFMAIAERALENGDTQVAAHVLASGRNLDRMVRRIDMPSWNARISVARARLALMMSYEAKYGPRCLLDPAHRERLARRWIPPHHLEEPN